MSEAPSKRQRLAGSFSPASPPYHLAKPTETTHPVVQPNTPTSPGYMSSTQRPNAGSATAGHAPPGDMTPPSSVNMSQQPSQSAAPASGPMPFPTPGSTTGGGSSINMDSDGDAMMVDDANEDAAAKVAGSRAGSGMSGFTRSDHNRQGQESPAGHDAGSGERRVCGDSLAKLCVRPHAPTQPHISQNMFADYGLDGIARLVARTDPKTGEKINKLRKSYEGQIKNMQISGKPRAVKWDAPGAITRAVFTPDADWWNSAVSGKDLKAQAPGSLDDSRASGFTFDFEKELDQALSMAPGKLPAHETHQFKAYLATDDGARRATNEIPERSLQAGLSRSSVPSPRMGPSTDPTRPARPERSGTKRRYDEAGWVGYSEGYVDDEAEGTGGEDDGRNSLRRKKQRKDLPAGGSFAWNNHQRGLTVGAQR